jgi:hypothetical protein
MPNYAYIIPTKFENVRTGRIDYGFRVFDDYAEANVLPWDLESIPDDDLECLRLCLESEYESVKGILNYVEDNQMPLMIGEVAYSWEEIKDCFEKEKK